MDASNELWGSGKLILGPMVRASSLPLRLAALSYGADVVYSEEIPAHRAASGHCSRIINPVLGTVDFLETKHGHGETLVLFRTHADLEVAPRRCVLQLGTSTATTALRAAQLFERDVAAIDINMGCAKHYSVSRGMGSALMDRPEVAEDIVKTLRRNLSIPVSVKTRIFDSSGSTCGDVYKCSSSLASSRSESRSVEWLQRLQKCGAQAIAVHMRTASEKNRDLAHHDMFGLLHSHMRCTNTPLVYNGDIWTYSDIEKVHEGMHAADGPSCSPTGTSTDPQLPEPAVMVCRAGLWNPSVFAQLKIERSRRQKNSHSEWPSDANTEASCEVTLPNLLARIVKVSAETANCPLNTRYLLQQILAGARKLDSDVRNRIVRSGTLSEVAAALDIAAQVLAEKEIQHRAWRPYLLGVETQNPESTSCCSRIDANLCEDDAPESANSTSNRAAMASNSSHGALLSAYFNAQHWPGIVSRTSHEYSDRYFDDNYYVAFARPQSALNVANVVGGGGLVPSVKKAFAFSGFTESNTTVVRVKRKATEVSR